MYAIFQKNIKNYGHLTNNITQRIYIILYVGSTQFHKKCTQLYTMNVHNFSKNVENSAYLTNIIAQRIYIILDQNGHIPLFGKLCNNQPLFLKYMGIYHCKDTNWVLNPKRKRI